MPEQNSRTKEIARIGISLIILAVGVAGFVVLMKLKQQPAGADVPKKPLVVRTTPIASHVEMLKIKARGVVVPYREVAVSAEVAGRITFKSPECRAGKYIDLQKTPDIVLIKIDDTDYQFEVDRLTEEQNRAVAQIEEWKTEKAGTEKLLALATEQYTSQEQEYQRQTKVRGVLSPADLDKAKRALLSAENTMTTLANQKDLLEQGEARLQAAKKLVDAQLARAKADLARTTISAPVSGVIVSDDVEQGQYVQKGTLLFTIEDTSRVEVQSNLTKEDMKWIWMSQPATANGGDPRGSYQIPQLDVSVVYEFGGQEFAWQGKLDRFDGIGVDSKTRTIPCRVLVEHPRDVRAATGGQSLLGAPRALVRNMYVTVWIHAKPQVPLWKVPRSAVRPGNLIWIVRDGKLEKRNVVVAQQLNEETIVQLPSGALSPIDRVVTSPLSYPRDGLQVEENPAS